MSDAQQASTSLSPACAALPLPAAGEAWHQASKRIARSWSVPMSGLPSGLSIRTRRNRARARRSERRPHRHRRVEADIGCGGNENCQPEPNVHARCGPWTRKSGRAFSDRALVLPSASNATPDRAALERPLGGSARSSLGQAASPKGTGRRRHGHTTCAPCSISSAFNSDRWHRFSSSQ
jgi:hypothetical protein